MASNKATTEKPPRITDNANASPENQIPPINSAEDDGTVPPEELKNDPNAKDYLNDNLENTSDPAENKEPETPPTNSDDKPSDTPVEQPKQIALDEETIKKMAKGGGDSMIAVISLITQMQQQMMELQTQVANKVDTSKIDPKTFLVSGATANDAARHADKAKRTADFVNSQPKVNIFIPLEGKEKVGTAVLPVTINGHRWNVPKGIYVECPKSVADIVKESLNQTEQAYMNEFRLDNAPEDRKTALQGSSGVVSEG